MSSRDSDPVYDKEAEESAYNITRKLFVITALGAAVFCGAVAIFML